MTILCWAPRTELQSHRLDRLILRRARSTHSAEIVLKVSADGDIAVLRGGEVIATLLG